MSVEIKQLENETWAEYRARLVKGYDVKAKVEQKARDEQRYQDEISELDDKISNIKIELAKETVVEVDNIEFNDITIDFNAVISRITEDARQELISTQKIVANNIARREARREHELNEVVTAIKSNNKKEGVRRVWTRKGRVATDEQINDVLKNYNYEYRWWSQHPMNTKWGMTTRKAHDKLIKVLANEQ